MPDKNQKKFNFSDVSVVFFTGFQNKLCGRQVQKFEPFFNERDISCTSFHDKNRAFFLNGDDSSSSEEELISKLATICKERKHTFFVGASGGGFAAIKYGMLLNVSKIITFSGFTSFD